MWQGALAISFTNANWSSMGALAQFLAFVSLHYQRQQTSLNPRNGDWVVYWAPPIAQGLEQMHAIALTWEICFNEVFHARFFKVIFLKCAFKTFVMGDNSNEKTFETLKLGNDFCHFNKGVP